MKSTTKSTLFFTPTTSYPQDLYLNSSTATKHRINVFASSSSSNLKNYSSNSYRTINNPEQPSATSGMHAKIAKLTF